MTRSNLIRLLQRAYRVAHFSQQTHCSSTDAHAIFNERFSRRKVLHAGVAIAGLAAVPQSLRPSSTSTIQDSPVLVVGAGIAGLTVAYRLQQAGIPVDVIEATRRVGGRLRSVVNLPDAPGTVELGGEFIDTRHTAVRSLAAELGLELADLHTADRGLDWEILYFDGKKYTHPEIAERFAPIAQRITHDLTQLGQRDFTYQTASATATQLDQLSLAEYLQQVSADPVIDQLIKVAYITEFGLDADEQSCLNMLYLIGREVGQWSTYGLSDERWHVVGGNDQIPKRLATRLENVIEPATVLESIRSTADGRYRVSVRQDGTSRDRTYERIVLTVPFSVLRNINLDLDLPPQKQQAIQQLGYGTSTKLATPFKERIWRTRYQSTIYIYTDRDFQNTWESARYLPGTAGWVTDLRAGQQGMALGQGNPEDHAQALVNDLEALFPGISQVERGRALRAFWAAEPYALGSYSCYKPGQWTRFGGAEGERVGNIWFAGEHCATESQGYMNGACETAELAALGIMDDMGQTQAAAQQRDRMTQFQVEAVA